MAIDILIPIYWVAILVLLFSFTIFVHELGHFLTALACGMAVETFSIGFGPAVWKRKIRGITYKIGSIPFGGYVALPQLDPSGMQHIQGGGDGEEATLPDVAAWKKILVSLSGVTGNLILAVILAWVIYLHPGAVTAGDRPLKLDVDPGSAAYEAGLRAGDVVLAVEGEPVRSWNEFLTEAHLGGGAAEHVALRVRSGKTEQTLSIPTVATEGGIRMIEGVRPAAPPAVIGELLPDSAAAEAGLREGDRIAVYNGEPVRDWEHFMQLVVAAGEQDVPMTIVRDGETLTRTVAPRYVEAYEKVMVGVGPVDLVAPPWMQYKQPWDQVRHDAKGIIRILRALTSRREGVARKAVGALGGPPMILAVLWASIQVSFLNALGFIRFLNINLAILNLLPIPVLDGGHIVFALWELFTGRKAHPRLVNILINIFAALLIGAMVLLTWRDMFRIFPGLGKLLDRRAAAEAPAVPGRDE